MSSIGDSGARARALDPTRSFIVQAPAGSGKTELLIQRYLRLLAGVNEPEQVLAITFTRKAAAEMRARVLAALREAGEQARELSAHKQQTRELAKAVLARDAQRDWNIQADPQRMRIGTLDSFNTALAMHLPLLSGGAGGSQICEDAGALYREAARRTVESIWQEGSGSDTRSEVLAELDFDTAGAERLIVGLLEVRDQWIGWLLDADAAMRDSADAIASLQRLYIEQADAALDDALFAELISLTRHANEHGSDAMQTATSGIHSNSRFEQLRAIANLLLTQSGSVRRRITKNEGFAPQFKAAKEQMAAVLESVERLDALVTTLNDLRRLPGTELEAADRTMLEAIAELLRHAVAELRVLFARRRLVDFTELSLAARYALGNVDEPSELLLALDQRIAHILIDEFQDTSVAQSELLETLTAGWTPGDGRTLFLVGDPMQSIYRFRNADMSLFIAARQYGIGDVVCEALDLSANFRSAPAVVDWVNTAFSQCFPPADDLQRGVAAFKPGAAVRPQEIDDRVEAHALGSGELGDEHAAVLEILANEREQHPDSHVAILVRSRSHLAGFRRLLLEHGWQARAVEIDAPYTSQLTQDLIGLARALTHLGDRLAWLALLRAPWCGLRWSDLELLVGDDADITVREALHDEARLARLDEDTRERVTGTRDVLELALRRRAALPFSHWLEETWRALCGPQTLADPHDEAQLDELLAIFDQIAVDQDIPDVAELEAFFRQPLRQPDSGEGGIDIMTIHRAKGLEFDCVILPGLARQPRGEDRRLVEWFDTFDSEGERARVIAPLRRNESAAVEWIRASARERSRAEVARLLYVATTRARNRLHLVWGLENDKKPSEASLLRPVWPLLEDTPVVQVAGESESERRIQLPLQRLPAALRVPDVPGDVPDAPAPDSPPPETARLWTSGTAAGVGIVVHQWLQTFCEQPHAAWNAATISGYRETFADQLRLLGVPPDQLHHAQENVLQALLRVIEDTRGLWIIGAREEAESEVMLSSVISGHVVHQRLDRTFVDEGVRWIVDYKTSVCQDDNLEAFLDAEVQKYRAQLDRYASFMAQRDTRPIRLGLYFPMMPAFTHWPAS